MDNLHARISPLIVDQKGCFFSCNRAQEKARKENNKVDFASDIPADFITVFSALPSATSQAQRAGIRYILEMNAAVLILQIVYF